MACLQLLAYYVGMYAIHIQKHSFVLTHPQLHVLFPMHKLILGMFTCQ